MNRYLAAFKENYNTVGLATFAAVSAATLNPLPLLAGLVAEAAYLLIVPDSKWYQTRLSQRRDAEIEQQRQQLKQQILPTLRPEIQARFAHLEEMRRQINLQDDKSWYREVMQKLDYLLEKFLLFGAKEAQFQSYLVRLRDEIQGGRAPSPRGKATGFSPLDREENSPGEDKRPGRRGSKSGGRIPYDLPQRPLRLVNGSDFEAQSDSQNDQWVQRTVTEIQAHYNSEIERIEQMLQNDQDDANRAVLTKRVDVLQRRSEFAGKIGKILNNINHQLQLVDDTFGLINDEIRARSPEQILADIDEVVVATDSMSTTLEEIAPYEQMVARLGS